MYYTYVMMQTMALVCLSRRNEEGVTERLVKIPAVFQCDIWLGGL